MNLPRYDDNCTHCGRHCLDAGWMIRTGFGFPDTRPRSSMCERCLRNSCENLGSEILDTLEYEGLSLSSSAADVQDALSRYRPLVPIELVGWLMRLAREAEARRQQRVTGSAELLLEFRPHYEGLLQLIPAKLARTATVLPLYWLTAGSYRFGDFSQNALVLAKPRGVRLEPSRIAELESAVGGPVAFADAYEEELLVALARHYPLDGEDPDPDELLARAAQHDDED